ncbi:MAG TPA: carbohydrate-binding family 9-like protein, partial [Eudoraea sp.]|nr:carbohydrate-binding family 9-like protein [Eudoraea sp.]
NNGTTMLTVKAITFEGAAELHQVSELLEAQTRRHEIGTLNWEAFPYQPEVAFRIGYHDDEIWLKYYIKEAHVLAIRTETNSATHRDSCLEFFLDPGGDGNYYNFEVNAIGTTHLAYGPGRENRTFIAPELIEDKIKVTSTLGKEPFAGGTKEQSWEMTMVIPVEILVYDKGIKLPGLKARANFYKCGDDSAIPHYLSWNPVPTDRPDFHTPEYFGTLHFE